MQLVRCPLHFRVARISLVLVLFAFDHFFSPNFLTSFHLNCIIVLLQLFSIKASYFSITRSFHKWIIVMLFPYNIMVQKQPINRLPGSMHCIWLMTGTSRNKKNKRLQKIYLYPNKTGVKPPTYCLLPESARGSNMPL